MQNFKNNYIELYDAICNLNVSRDEMKNFFIDLCTPAELKALEERWRVCQLLEYSDLSYRDIHNSTGVSITTIGRVARFLRDESNGGYRSFLKKLAFHSKKSLPDK